MRLITPILGISAVALLCSTLAAFTFLNPGFSLLNDYVSKLGASGQPFSFWWNVVGFLTVGILLTAFGFSYGRILQDRLTAAFLALFGVGFAATAMPTNLQDATVPISKAHVVAICLALAAWALGLARMTVLSTIAKMDRTIANVSAVLMILPILGFLMGRWSMPVTHRLVFTVVFGWYLVVSFRQLTTITRSASAGDMPNK
jgi:hypothetical membrane protein